MELSAILSGLIKIFGSITTIGKDRRELKDSALRAINTALVETYLYYRDVKPESRDLDREAILVKYWAAAAIPIRHFDSELADICSLKADYWLNPQNYNDNQIVELGIELDNVRQAYRRHLPPVYAFKKKSN